MVLAEQNKQQSLKLPMRLPTLANLLQDQGYQTGMVGKFHINARFGPHPPSGYEESGDYWDKHPEIAE
jgi:arylsulfatase A-like enzyme